MFFVQAYREPGRLHLSRKHRAKGLGGPSDVERGSNTQNETLVPTLDLQEDSTLVFVLTLFLFMFSISQLPAFLVISFSGKIYASQNTACGGCFRHSKDVLNYLILLIN